MNKQRRKELERISGELTMLYFDLNDVWLAEFNAYENLPDSLKQSDRGLAMECWIDKLDEWCDGIEEVYSAIDEMLEV